MGPQKYRKRPVEVMVLQWTGENFEDVFLFTESNFRWLPDSPNQRTDGVTAQVWDKLHNNWVNVYTGQSIIRGVQGEFYPISAEILEQTYEICDTGNKQPGEGCPQPTPADSMAK